VIAFPPLFAGDAKDTASAVLPPVVPVIVGGSGTVTAGTAVFDATDNALVPTALVAVAVHVYTFPLVKPFTMIGLAAPEAVPVAPPFED
jgi:hypothetical protein